MTEKKEKYMKNAGVAGSIPTQENWATANGKMGDKLKAMITDADVKNFLYEEAKRQGITVEELLIQMANGK